MKKNPIWFFSRDRGPDGSVGCSNFDEKISKIFDPKICTSRFKTHQSVPFRDIFVFLSTVADDESRVTTIFQGCPVSVLLVGEVLNCLNRKNKSYFFLSDRRFLNLLNHKKKSYCGFSGGKNRKSFKNPISEKNKKNPLKK